jgi:hypothetical protein
MVDAMESDHLSVHWDVMEAVDEEGPLALTAAVAAFATTWRFSSCTIRTGKQRSQEIIR